MFNSLKDIPKKGTESGDRIFSILDSPELQSILELLIINEIRNFGESGNKTKSELIAYASKLKAFEELRDFSGFLKDQQEHEEINDDDQDIE